MKLLDIGEVFNENKTLVVVDNATGEILATYDGKNSIPNEYNECRVTYVSPCADTLTVCITVGF